jgi:hypothetical protein
MAQAAAAEAVESLSFGANDLTPDLPCSFARDDPNRFLADYTAKGILPGRIASLRRFGDPLM